MSLKSAQTGFGSKGDSPWRRRPENLEGGVQLLGMRGYLPRAGVPSFKPQSTTHHRLWYWQQPPLSLQPEKSVEIQQLSLGPLAAVLLGSLMPARLLPFLSGRPHTWNWVLLLLLLLLPALLGHLVRTLGSCLVGPKSIHSFAFEALQRTNINLSASVSKFWSQESQ